MKLFSTDHSKSILAAFALILMGCASVDKAPIKQSGLFQIPSDAKLTIQSYGSDSSQGSQAEDCKADRPDEKEIRHQFQVAHLLKGSELHDNYLWTPCYADGSISLHGKVMKWRFRIGNVIETTFPDGKNKILGGEPTDSPSEE